MKRVGFGMITFIFTVPQEDHKPEMVEVKYGDELLYCGSPEQFHRMLKAFKVVSQKG